MDIQQRVSLMGELRDVEKRSKKLQLTCPAIITPPWFAHYDGNKGYPVRMGNIVEPLISGERTFTQIYNAIYRADKFINIALWSLMPGFRLLRGNTNKQLDSIGELLIDRAQRGVQVRILLWGLYSSGTVIKLSTLKAKAKDDPYYRDDWDWYEDIKKVPNLQLRFENTKSYMASHHQKTVTIDNKTGFVMGMNMRTADWDTPENKVFNLLRDPDSTPRHDISAKVEGPCVKDLEKNFFERWARSGRQYTDFVPLIIAGRPIPVPVRREKHPEQSSNEDKRLIENIKQLNIAPRSNGIQAQIVRTRKVKKEESIFKIYKQAIANANHYLYMENQYFRHEELAEAIAKRVKARKGDFDFILAIRVPDSTIERAPTTDTLEIVEDAYEKFGKTFTPYCLISHTNTYQAATTLINHLKQYDSIHSDDIYACAVAIWGEKSTQAAYIKHIKDYLSNTHKNELIEVAKSIKDKDSFHYQAIDAHVKTLIVDDIFASIGSANLNIRSMDYDSEINIAFKDKKTVKQLRLDLWTKHINPELLTKSPIGSEILINNKPTGIINGVNAWHETAKQNKKSYKSKKALSGSVMPLKMLMKSKWYDFLLQIPFMTEPVIDYYVDNDSSPQTSDYA